MFWYLNALYNNLSKSDTKHHFIKSDDFRRTIYVRMC
jgi:hypothetical protein